jgi:large subunit ribosomal protein L4
MAPSKPTAPVLGDGTAKASLDPAVFGAEVRPHLVHETVRAELAAERAGTRALKTRGLVAGGRGKPWRQKGTGRARAGTIRAAQWTGGGAAFQPRTSFAVKVNKKARRSALRSALSAHAQAGTVAVLDPSAFAEPSTRRAGELLDDWGKDRPTVVVATPDDESVGKSFRNLSRVLIVEPSDLDVGALVWARSLVVTQGALEKVQELAR